MRKTYNPFLIFCFLIPLILNAQLPQAFNYQAIARNASGNAVVNQFISVEISIRDGSPTAAIVYQEIDTTTTNQFGLFAIAVGLGQVQVGTSLSAINWTTGNKYMQVGFDQTGGNNFTDMGTTELLSVPYALYAASSGATDSAVFVHYIGQLYGGGIVVAVWKDSTVEHGLIASLNDISTSSIWSNVSATQIGASAKSQFDGAQNTTAILGQSGATSGAAFLCHNYASGGYTDWYLPAIWELQQCWNAFMIVDKVLGGTSGFQLAYYWSSTEADSQNAWYSLFNYGNTVNSSGKSGPSLYNVRAVRRY